MKSIIRHWPLNYVLPTWIGLSGVFVFLFAFIPILTYAIISPEEESQTSAYWGTYSQGWPLTYLIRQVDTTAYKGMWFLWRGVSHFSPWIMAIDIAIVVLIALAIISLWLWHTARQRWWQFSLKELLCFVTIVAICVSYCCLPIVERQREEFIAAQLEKMGWVLTGNEPVSPNWIMRPFVDIGIIGRDNFWRFRSIAWQGRTSESIEEMIGRNVKNSKLDDFIDDTTQLITRMKYCNEIHICGSLLSNKGLESLSKKWSGCRRADFGNSTGFDDVGLNQVVENWPDLEELDLTGTAMSDRGILALAKLPSLSILNIGDMDCLTIDGTKKLMQHCRALKILTVSANWQDNKTFQQLQQMAENQGIDVIVVSRKKGIVP
jgi:hypothetical protein